jgi:hypothetical protein
MTGTEGTIEYPHDANAPTRTSASRRIVMEDLPFRALARRFASFLDMSALRAGARGQAHAVAATDMPQTLHHIEPHTQLVLTARRSYTSCCVTPTWLSGANAAGCLWTTCPASVRCARIIIHIMSPIPMGQANTASVLTTEVPMPPNAVPTTGKMSNRTRGTVHRNMRPSLTCL